MSAFSRWLAWLLPRGQRIAALESPPIPDPPSPGPPPPDPPPPEPVIPPVVVAPSPVVVPVSFQHLVVALDNAKYHGGDRKKPVTLIVIHCTAGGTALSSIQWMNRPGAVGVASYHYIIDRKRDGGKIYRHLPVEKVAYHAGDSAWPADKTRLKQGTSVNPFSIGIAFANKNDGEPIEPEQIAKAEWLCHLFMKRYGFGPSRVVGHMEVSPKRKTDPLPSVLAMKDFRELLVNGR